MQRRDRRSVRSPLPVVQSAGSDRAQEATGGARDPAAPTGVQQPAQADDAVPRKTLAFPRGDDPELPTHLPTAPKREGAADRLPATIPLYTAECAGLKLTSPNRVRGITRGAALAQAAKVKRVRELGLLVTRGNVPPLAITGPMVYKARVHVTITRIAPRFFDDDNFISSCKPMRDGISDAFSLKDNDPRISFSYEQAHGKPRQYAVRVSYLITSA